ncbi:MAG: hypothetical protein SGJ26_00915 [Nitrospirota bacterium]|nr:hypothetical protein [Nitrospirota bacterium]
MATADIAGMRDSRGQHTGVPRGNIRAKLLDYIEQVFECKADTLELFAWVLCTLAGKAQQTTIRSSEFFFGTSNFRSPFMQVLPVSLGQGICT